ncbi:MAG: preprotein translocase subunit SecG [Clostridia bacterium]|nr:preprotein translocase subunit SecG [Clostridia bacterium]
MGTLDYVLGGILLVAAVFLIIAVLMQQGKSKGLGAVGGGSSDTFYGKTKGKSWDKMLSKLTTIVGIFFVVIVLLVYIIQDDVDYDKFLDDKLNNPDAQTTVVDETKKEEPKDTEETTAEEETEADTTAEATEA